MFGAESGRRQQPAGPAGPPAEPAGGGPQPDHGHQAAGVPGAARPVDCSSGLTAPLEVRDEVAGSLWHKAGLHAKKESIKGTIMPFMP